MRAAGDLRRAWDVLTIHNPFPAIAGRICHHPCETACNRGAYDDALSICRLERAAGDAALAAGWQYEPPAEELPGHVAIVGGGPSGLSAAYQLRRRGWRVSLYEAREELGGLMRYGIPPYRLARAGAGRRDRPHRAARRAGPLQPPAGRPRRPGAAGRHGHDAVYLATGAAISRPLPQFAADAPWLMQGSDYLALSNAGQPPRLGRRVAVIGGGSAAMDVARSARRAGCEVMLLALEPRDRLPAQREELHEALEEGVVLHDATLLRTVVGDAGEPLSLGCIRVRLESAARGEAPRITPVEDSSFTLEADAVLVAIGQQADLQPFGDLQAAGGLLQVDAGQTTSDPRIWAGGDVASLARFVTEAVGMGKRAALDIDRALRGLPRVRPVLPPRTTLQEIATWYYPHARRPGERRQPPEQRLADGGEVQLALTQQEVAAEASRCFSCGTCTSCDNCFQFCPDLAITHVDGGYAVLADYCKGCGLCVRECPTGSMLLKEEVRMSQPQTLLLDGNHAVSWAARLARPQVVPLYPITPQTPILELITAFHARGEMQAEILTPESEHSVLAACVPASLAGARVFTATASQGLLLMHEVLHYAAGARAPIVMANVNRTVASPWAFWPDQTDSLAQRDTGWIQYYSESPQESLDTVLQAFRVAEQVGLPAMVNHDAFYVSHALEAVQVPGAGDWSTDSCRPTRRPSACRPRSARPGATW